MKSNIKIGTRDSQLALWQAKLVQQKMGSFTTSEIVEIKSEGDIDLISPLYEMGVQGIFTKSLDIALLQKTIDVAVHSLKDVPTQLPQGLIIAAILPRANYHDWMVIKNPSIDLLAPLTIATSSLRRKAQWLHRYPNHTFESLRGNINKRLQKLNDNQQWSGALFAAAGIERIGLAVPHYMELDWMLPAPAQGAIAVVCRDDDTIAKDICVLLQDEKTAICVQAERLFLRELMGGCTMPIAALATIDENNKMTFKGNILTIDGKQKAEAEMNFNANEFSEAGKKLAALVLKNGGEEILKKIKGLTI
ncbi:MAG: hydroxymethylbilane synthase [Bacteroidota bacterium]